MKVRKIMANNRFYLYCPKCKDIYFIGKCMGFCEIYHVIGYKKALTEIYGWMTNHLQDCYGYDSFYKGEVFKVLTEYDKRVDNAQIRNRKLISKKGREK